jgi:hypothetical protein
MPQGLRRGVFGMPIIIPIRNHNWNDVKQVEKFGANHDVDTNSDPEDCWTQGGTYTFLTTATALYASSSSAADTVSINVQGLDGDWNLQTKSVTLTGQTQALIPGTWLRVFRAYNESATLLAGDVYIAGDAGAAITGGVPDVASLIKAKIDLGDGQTMMAIYTVPNGYTAYMTRWYATLAVSRASYAVVQLRKRASGGVFRASREIGLTGAGNSIYQELLNIAIPYASKTDIKITIKEVGANDMDVDGGFDLLLVGDT